LVGAMMVAGIESVWHGHYQPNTVMTQEFSDQVKTSQPKVTLQKGEEMGRFKFGSTAILLFEPGKTTWGDQYKPGTQTKLGELLALTSN